MSKDTIKLGDCVLATPKGSPHITGVVISFVDSLTRGKFAVVIDYKGRSHHCTLNEMSKA